MATQGRDGKRKRRRTLEDYFYVDGDLCRLLHVQQATDVATVWNYPRRKRLGYSYSDLKKRAEKCWKTIQVADMLNRSRLSILLAVEAGDIAQPQKSYSLKNGPDHRVAYAYRWSEKDIFNAWEYFSQIHRGRPRKDGLITVSNIPSAAELKALTRNDRILYVKTADGQFVPSWKA